QLEGTFVAMENDKIIGFANATINNQGKDPRLTPGYITCIAVDYRYTRQGIGSKLLLALESYLKALGKTYVRNLFFNPINLEWLVPGYDKHEHPGAPAIPYNTPYYFLFMANGYNVNGQQDAYHLDLSHYTLPQDVKKKIAMNEQDGYTITYYDPKLHFGFDELFDALKNEGWREVVKNNLAKQKPDPMLIVQKEGEILGWTGPVFTQPSGRGYLGGIGVHPKTQGHGLGKSLFCMLCQRSKENNAKFMTLFTGSDNKAREIYLYAGMKLVQSFAVLRKELH
ncbi:MAG: GNAT family N-acetyltransferase, partial [Bacilli bacterium]